MNENVMEIMSNDLSLIIDLANTNLKYVAQVYNVKGYGAVGNGNTDDTSAIQAAINAAGANGGGIVVFPPGTYAISTNLIVPSNVTLIGCGTGATILKLTTSVVLGGPVGFAFMINSVGTSNVHLSGFSLDGQGSIDSSGVRGGCGIHFDGVQGFSIKDIHAYDMGTPHVGAVTSDLFYGGMGIMVDGRNRDSKDGVIYNCRVERIAGGGGSVGDGIYVGGYNSDINIKTHNIVVDSCFVSTVGRHCYTVAGEGTEAIPEHIKIVNCFGDKSAMDGVDIEQGNFVTVDNCTFSQCGNDQTYYNPKAVYGATFRLLWGIAATDSMGEITITNNNFIDCYGSISTSATQRVIIKGNRSKNSKSIDYDYLISQGSGLIDSIIEGNIISNPAGVGIYGYFCQSLTIKGNIIYNAVLQGIRLIGDTTSNNGIILEGNHISGCLSDGIWLQNQDGVQILGNRIKNNKTYGLHIYSGSVLLQNVICNNVIYDDQATKTQMYGIYYEVGNPQDYYVVTGNHLRGNGTAATLGTLGVNSIVANNVV